MSLKNIELEFRAVVNRSQYSRLFVQLRSKAKLISHTKRLSVMFFGNIKNTALDIRIRITNGIPELVIKKGALHASDRIEASCLINRPQFIELVKLFTLFSFKSEVAERDTYNFEMGNKIIFSLIKANDIAYVEVEKLSDKGSISKNREQILKIFNKYQLKLLAGAGEFDKLCRRLSKQSDWKFTGLPADYHKLKKIFAKY